MQESVIVLVYGCGGHQSQMQRLLAKKLINENDNITLIGITDSLHPINRPIIRTYIFKEFRDKKSNWITLLTLPFSVLALIIRTLILLFKFKVKAVITTGPGLAIIPCLIFWLFNKKLIVFETWSKFYKPSITAKVLYRFSGLFIIQHQTMSKVFPKAKYWGRL